MSRITKYVGQHAVAFLALLVALGGSAYAAATVNSSDIQNNSIKSKDIRDNAVTSDDLGSFESSFAVSPRTFTENLVPNLTYEIEATCDNSGLRFGGGGAVWASVYSSTPLLVVEDLFYREADGTDVPPGQFPEGADLWVRLRMTGDAVLPNQTYTVYSLCSGVPPS